MNPTQFDREAFRQQAIQQGHDPSQVDAFYKALDNGWQPPQNNQNDIVSQSYLSHYLQPSLENERIKANTVQSQVSTATSESEKARIDAEKKLTDYQLAQQDAFKNYGAEFNKLKSKTDGKVAPDIYNNIKEEAASKYGITEEAFENKFNQYTDPNNIWYNTPEGRLNQKAYADVKRQIQTQIDNFDSVPNDQKGYYSKSIAEKFPWLAQIIAPQATSYEQSRLGLSAQLGQIAGAGAGTGLRVTQAELNRWANLTPSTRNNPAANDKNKQILNSELKAKFNVPIGLDQKYLPSDTQRPSLDQLLGQ